MISLLGWVILGHVLGTCLSLLLGPTLTLPMGQVREVPLALATKPRTSKYPKGMCHPKVLLLTKGDSC